MSEEDYPGETLNALYVQPTLDELDSPHHYVTAMVASNGKTAIILKTGHKIERHDNLHFIPEDLNDALAAILDPPYGILSDPENQGQQDQQTGVLGLININPRNNADFEFVLVTNTGERITRDTLHEEGTEYSYEGMATWIFFYPKGNGNQNWLTCNDVTEYLRNGRLYTIAGPSMDVHLYNLACNGNGNGGSSNGNGKAMGRWWLEINAPEATLTDHGPGSSGVPPVQE